MDNRNKQVAAGLSPNFGRALGLLRGLRKLTLAELARRTGASKGQISGYENGKEVPKLESLARLLGELKCELLEFFYVVRVLDELETDLQSEAGPPVDASVLTGSEVLEGEVEDGFRVLLDDVLNLHRRLIKAQLITGGKSRPSLC